MRDIEELLPNWTPPPAPPSDLILTGRHVRLERLTDGHLADLHAANRLDTEGRNWDYLPYGPFETLDGYRDWFHATCRTPDPFFMAIIDLTSGHAVGVASYLRISPGAGSIEVGHINYSPRLQRTIGATEAMFLMMQWAFEAGYRRYEWKCNAANIPSRRAAERLGFSYEGVFRQMMIVKGRNRDTAWFAAIDKEWPQLRAAFTAWLSPANFAPDGRQIRPLGGLTTPARVASDPALSAD